MKYLSGHQNIVTMCFVNLVNHGYIKIRFSYFLHLSYLILIGMMG